MPERVPNLAVIGWGNFFSHIHEQTVRELVAEGRAKLKTVCVASEVELRTIGQRISFARGTTDWDEVVNDPSIDAVLIGTPHSLQARLSIECLKAGKWVYVEKPMFAEESDTVEPQEEVYQRLLELGESARQRLAVGFNKRFAPAYLDMRRIARANGGLRHMQFTIMDDAWRWGSKYEPGFLLWLDIGHWLDLGRWFTGSEVKRISCLSPQVEDSLVTAQLADGSTLSVFLSGNATMDAPKEELRGISANRISFRAVDYIQLEVFGGPDPDRRIYPANLQSGGDTKLTAAITREGLTAFGRIRREQFEIFTRQQQNGPVDPDRTAYLKRNIPNFMRDQGWRNSVRAFVASVAANRPLENNASYEDAHIAYRLLDVARESQRRDGAFVAVEG